MKYDQLNRLLEARSYTDGLSGNLWSPTAYGGKYFNKFTYDANGNILTQQRRNSTGAMLDSLTYHYLLDDYGNLVRNRLYHVNDSAGFQNAGDLSDQGTFVDTSYFAVENYNNYKYDEEGRLIQDLAEGIENIVWRVDGKVKKVIFTTVSAKNNLEFDYDAFGRRIAKHVIGQDSILLKSNYYILDATGNQLSVFEHVTSDTTAPYQLTERVIYGSSRLGMNTTKVDMLNDEPDTLISFVLGNKLYEMSNHLGNVLTVINDIKMPISSDSISVDGYLATIVSTADYSPFGVQLDERTVSAESYRYGFNSMEKDDELKGNGNSYDFGARIYDPRLGRFLRVDPKQNKLPSVTPYAYAINSPILYIDLRGEHPKVAIILGPPNGQKGHHDFDDHVAALRKAGYVVVYAENGRQALELMNKYSSAESPTKNLVLLAHGSPGGMANGSGGGIYTQMELESRAKEDFLSDEDDSKFKAYLDFMGITSDPNDPNYEADLFDDGSFARDFRRWQINEWSRDKEEIIKQYRENSGAITIEDITQNMSNGSFQTENLVIVVGGCNSAGYENLDTQTIFSLRLAQSTGATVFGAQGDTAPIHGSSKRTSTFTWAVISTSTL